MTLDATDQRAIVWTAKRIRDQLHGARNWDEAGIAVAVAKVTHLHLADVMMAACRAADDRSLDTPGAIGNPSAPCWAERRTDRPQPVERFDRGETCTTCGRPEDRCRARTAVMAERGIPDAHDFESVQQRDRRLAAEPRRQEHA